MGVRSLAFAALLSIMASSALAAEPTHHRHKHRLMHTAGWAGAGFAAGAVAGPGGSAAVGAAKYRHDLKAGGHRRKHAIVKIGAPIAAGLIAGPPGIAAYEVYDHRDWINRHV